NVYTLRVVSDANTIAEQSAGKNVVCIGGSFIGMEIASALSSTAASVTVVCMTEEPLPPLGTDLGSVIREKRLEGEGEVTGVVLKSGEIIPADVVVTGIGVQPPTDWLKNTRIELNEAGFIEVDRHFRTSVDWVYAIGDAYSPHYLCDSHQINISIPTDQQHRLSFNGSCFGPDNLSKHQYRPTTRVLNCGVAFPHRVPYFWTLFFTEFGVRLAGCPQGAEHTVLHGSLAELKFAKYYLKQGVVVAVASAGPVPTAVQFLELFKRKIEITREDVEKNTDNDWLAWLE
ncbi:pyridine nucleotide-disulfide oxidoreductase, partial [Ostertagia ostertagi]